MEEQRLSQWKLVIGDFGGNGVGVGAGRGIYRNERRQHGPARTLTLRILSSSNLSSLPQKWFPYKCTLNGRKFKNKNKNENNKMKISIILFTLLDSWVNGKKSFLFLLYVWFENNSFPKRKGPVFPVLNLIGLKGCHVSMIDVANLMNQLNSKWRKVEKNLV